ncbi:hypothetical protein ACKC9G_09285 [Pokkaliibacter sp. CJK22405]|uniref:hypothetical protein n=1 Tax=Pokkaliibacter sp. CJK22405 TaxID=3384615 RepID=UPI003985079B
MTPYLLFKRYILVFSFIIYSLALNTAFGSDIPSSPFSSENQPKNRFDTSANEYFSFPEPSIKTRISRFNKNDQTNHFCIVGYQWTNGNMQVWVHWQEQLEIILWQGGDDEETQVDSMALARKELVLGRDTVKSEDDINGSTYLITEAAWHGIVDDCEKNGEKYTIPPFSPENTE